MNNAEPTVILFPGSCQACGKQLARPGAQYCSRQCRMILADYEEFYTLRIILGISRWAGAPSQAEQRRDYLCRRMRAAVRKLAASEDLLAAVLIEIAGIVEEQETEG